MSGLISEEDINQIRERNDLFEVVSDYVTLKKKGRLLWGLCPFHSEKTPSFKVDPALQLWHCFGCGEGGNVFTFLMKTEHLDFPEAVEALAERVGFEITRTETAGPSRSFRQRLFEVNQATAQYYAFYLRRNKTAGAAREYLKHRDFHIELATKFQIGYAPASRDELVKHLGARDFTTEEMVGAGVVVRTERGLKDRFFERIIFPIADIKGRIVGFGGRALGDATPKYLNSSETPVYHKSSTLYGLFQAKGEIVRRQRALVVEGYTDVIALHAAGFENAVATCGTALTAEHFKLLARFTNDVVLVFDADAAGMAAAERGMAFVSEFRAAGEGNLSDLSTKQRVDLSVAILPEGQDPADLITAGGAPGFEEVLGQAADLVEFAMDRKIAAHDLATSKGRIRAAQEALALVAALPSPVAQEEYLRVLTAKIGVGMDSLALEFKRLQRRTTSAAGAEEGPPPGLTDAQAKTEQEMLRLALADTEIRQKATAEADAELFTVPAHRQLYDVLAELGQGTPDAAGTGLVDRLDSDLQRVASGLLLDTRDVADKDSYFAEILARLKEFEVGRQIDRLKARIEKLNRLSDQQLYDSLFTELIQLEARRRKLKDETSGGAASAD